MATGVNDWGEVAGVWTDSAGNMHGFTWTKGVRRFLVGSVDVVAMRAAYRKERTDAHYG